MEEREELREKREESLEPVPGVEDPKAGLQEQRAWYDDMLNRMTLTVDGHDIPEKKLRRLKEGITELVMYCLLDLHADETEDLVVVRYDWAIPPMAPLKVGFIAGCRVMLTSNDRHKAMRFIPAPLPEDANPTKSDDHQADEAPAAELNYYDQQDGGE